MSMLWAITCFFNPVGYRRRLQNYRSFRERLTTPLVTVELSFTGEFVLGPGDAEVLIQLDQGDMLFQKERLLNIGLRHVPASCEAVAWIDCDVIFGSNDWATSTLQALEHYAVVQPFSERYDLLADSDPGETSTWGRPYDRLSLMESITRQNPAKTGNVSLTDTELRDVRQSKPAWGLAWAARKSILDLQGLYDGCVFASGDVAIFCAAIGAMDGQYMRARMNTPSFEHYLRWARPFHDAVRGSVGRIEGRLFHLWHGSIAERGYSTNVLELQDLGFDPFTDIAKTAQDTWRWSSDKPRLHQHVREYFWLRNEDGERVAGVL